MAHHWVRHHSLGCITDSLTHGGLTPAWTPRRSLTPPMDPSPLAHPPHGPLAARSPPPLGSLTLGCALSLTLHGAIVPSHSLLLIHSMEASWPVTPSLSLTRWSHCTLSLIPHGAFAPVDTTCMQPSWFTLTACSPADSLPIDTTSCNTACMQQSSAGSP